MELCFFIYRLHWSWQWMPWKARLFYRPAAQCPVICFNAKCFTAPNLQTSKQSFILKQWSVLIPTAFAYKVQLSTIKTLSSVNHLTFPYSDCNRLVTIFIIPDLVCSISLLSPPDSPSFLSLSCLKNCRLFYHLIWLSDYKRFREIIGSVVVCSIVSLMSSSSSDVSAH